MRQTQKGNRCGRRKKNPPNGICGTPKVPKGSVVHDPGEITLVGRAKVVVFEGVPGHVQARGWRVCPVAGKLLFNQGGDAGEQLPEAYVRVRRGVDTQVAVRVDESGVDLYGARGGTDAGVGERTRAVQVDGRGERRGGVEPAGGQVGDARRVVAGLDVLEALEGRVPAEIVSGQIRVQLLYLGHWARVGGAAAHPPAGVAADEDLVSSSKRLGREQSSRREQEEMQDGGDHDGCRAAQDSYGLQPPAPHHLQKH